MTLRKKISKWGLVATLPALLLAAGCENLIDINQNPNALIDSKVDPAYVLTSVLTGSATKLAEISFTGNVTQKVVPEAMQYTQRDFLEFAVTNQFAWLRVGFDERSLHQPLANASYLGTRANGNADSLFIKGTSKTMQAMWFGLQTSMWGDVPYSQANQGTANLRPALDPQIDVFKGILRDLEQANDAFKRVTAVNSTVMTSSDLLYAGNVLKWRKFANSLHLRFLMRLSEKSAEMTAAGVNLSSEFNKIVSDPTNYPIITSAADDAAMKFPGTNTTDSWPMGPLITTTLTEFYRAKAGSTFVNYMKVRKDPRLTIFFRPVEVQTLVRDKGADVVIAKDEAGVVKRYIKTYQAGIDTSLYVGLSIAATNPDDYNNNVAAHRTAAVALNSAIYNSGATNPFASYLGTMYRTNTDPLVKSIFISAAEVNFTLAEAAAKGWITGSAADFAAAGISASLDQYGIANGNMKVYDPVSHATIAFDKAAFLANFKTEYEAATNKIEKIIEQKWIAAYTTMDGWFDYRRTGFPNISGNIIAGDQGQKIPVRYMYGDNEFNYNPANTNAAVQRLEPATNTQWSKMWLLQGTGKPW